MSASVPDPMLQVARNHVEHRTVALGDAKVLFVPVPKTGWTSMLWVLAELAGIPREAFDESTKPEVSAAMAVHDEQVWFRHGRLLRSLDQAARQAALTDAGWFRFSVVRDPARRLWSAWQSKLLLREPVYYGFHHERAWYPQRPDDPQTVLNDFRAFVAALAAGFGTETRMRDPHWGRQSEVVNELALTHLGRSESLGDTWDRLAAHVAGAGRTLAPLPRENAMPLPYHPLVFDREAADTVQQLYAADFDNFGYEPPQVVAGAVYDTAVRAWSERAVESFDQMNALIDRHQRIYALVTEFRSQQAATRQQMAGLEARVTSSEAQARRAEAQLVALQHDNERLRARYRRLTSSISWRLTAPLRRVRAAQLGLARPGKSSDHPASAGGDQER